MRLTPRHITALLVLLATAACASSRTVPAPFPGAATSRPEVSAARPVPPEAESVVETALSLRGSPYRNGGSSPSGFDCSGFIWYVFAVHGVAVPRTVVEQYRAGHGVHTDQLRAGDLVFFDTGATPASHVGVIVGPDSFVHAPSSRGQVRVEHLSAPYWSSRYVGARRVAE